MSNLTPGKSRLRELQPGGGTPLIYARELGQKLGYSQLFLKDEGANPTGSHKYRASIRIALVAGDRGFAGVTIGTCGNFGYALASACSQADLNCHVFIPMHYSGTLVTRIRRCGANVTLVAGTYEDAVEASQGFASQGHYFDANPLGEGGRIAVTSFMSIAEEVFATVGAAPSTVLIPVGNGTTLVGLDLGFRGLGLQPRMIAVGSIGNTALTASILAGRALELPPESLHETPANEPLLNWRSYHVQEALLAVVRSGGFACEVSDHELVRAAAQVSALERIQVAPAAAAGVAALGSPKVQLPRDEVHIVVLTSR